MRVALLIIICALLFGVYSQEVSSDSPTVLFDECYESLLPGEYCSRVTYSDCDTLMASFIIGETRAAREFAIDNLIAAQSTKLYCGSSVGENCDSCWSAYNVIIDGDTTQVCFNFAMSCSGIFGTHVSEDYPCVFLTGCSENPRDCDGVDCGENGKCGSDGVCECEENYYGTTCSILIEDGQYTDSSSGFTFSVDPQIDQSCALSTTITWPESGEIPPWILDPSYPPNILQFLMHEVLIDETMVTFEYQQLDIADNEITVSISATIGQFGPSYLIYESYVISVPEDCQRETPCQFSLDDRPILPPREFTLKEGESVFLKLYQVQDQPMVDLKLNLNVKGTLTCLEKKSMCRPAMDDADQIIYVTDEQKEWIIVDSPCNTTDSGEGLYYFGFYCFDGDCTFSYEIVYHTIDMMVVDGNGAIERPLYGPSNYQYFSFFIDEDPVDLILRIRIEKDLIDSLSQNVYVTTSGCASSINTEIPQIIKDVPLINEDWAYSDYTLVGIDPNTLGWVGKTVFVTAVVHSDCPEGQVCSSMMMSALSSTYIPLESPSPSPEVPVSPSPSPASVSPSVSLAPESPVPTPSASLSPESPVPTPSVSLSPESPVPTPSISPVPVSPVRSPVVTPKPSLESTPDETSPSSDTDSDYYEDDGDGDGEEEPNYFYLFFLIGVGVILLCVCVIAALVVVVVLRLRKTKNRSANFDINNDDSLQDEDFEL